MKALIIFALSIGGICTIAGCDTTDDNVTPWDRQSNTPGDSTEGEDGNTGTLPDTSDTPCSVPNAMPFGSRNARYVTGTISPGVDNASLDAAVIAFYDKWKAAYLGSGSPCNPGEYYVKANYAGSFVVSESQAYGMLIAVYMAGADPDARTIFDGMVAYLKSHPAKKSEHLLAWSQGNDCQDRTDPDGTTAATDGDMDIAYALLLAHKQWGSDGLIDYLNEARQVIAAVSQYERSASEEWLYLGDWIWTSRHRNSIRSSDFMPGHMDAFVTVAEDNSWNTTRDFTYDVLKQVQSQYAADTGLLPDFIEDVNASPRPASPAFLEGDNDGDYYWNACRVPWRLGVHYLTTGNGDAKLILDRMNGWMRATSSGSAANITPGYTLAGAPLNSGWISAAFYAPFGVSAMIDSDNQSWLDSIWALSSTAEVSSYYDDTIRLLALIAMSGNWWAPEQSTCRR